MLNISAFNACVLLKRYCNFTFPLSHSRRYLFIVLFYFVLLFNMHVFFIVILPACKWLAPFAADA